MFENCILVAILLLLVSCKNRDAEEGDGASTGTPQFSLRIQIEYSAHVQNIGRD